MYRKIISISLLVIFICSLGLAKPLGTEPNTSATKLTPPKKKTFPIVSNHHKGLSHIFSTGNQMPFLPSETEIEAITSKVKDYEKDNPSGVTEGWETQADYLRRFFGKNKRLWALAHRDSDGDGIRDYRVSTYFGLFFEGDLDIDNDGIRNVFDSHPYDCMIGGQDVDGDSLPDKLFIDKNKNKIPDHVDWNILADKGKKSRMAAWYQQKGFREFGILFVEQGYKFPESLARSTYDAIRIVFRKPLIEDKRKLPLKVIATRPRVYLEWTEGQLKRYTDFYGEAVDQDSTGAFNSFVSETIYVYPKLGSDIHPLEQLSLMTHEVMHSYQASFDLPKNSKVIGWNYNDYPKAVKYLAQFDWHLTHSEPLDKGEVKDYPLFTEEYGEQGPVYNSKYKDWTLEEWTRWMNGLGEDYLDDPEVMKYHLTGSYALASPWEWNADFLSAYLLLSLQDQLKAMMVTDNQDKEAKEKSLAEYNRIANAWTKKNKEVWGFKFQNIRGSKDIETFKRDFPLREADLYYLALRYVRNAF